MRSIGHRAFLFFLYSLIIYVEAGYLNLQSSQHVNEPLLQQGQNYAPHNSHTVLSGDYNSIQNPQAQNYLKYNRPNYNQINAQDSTVNYNVGIQNQLRSPNLYSATQQTVNYNNLQINDKDSQLHYNNVGSQNQQYAPNHYSATQLSLNNHNPQTHYQDFNNVGSQNQQHSPSHYSATQQSVNYNKPQTHYQDYNNVGNQNEQHSLNHYSATQQTVNYNNPQINNQNSQLYYNNVGSQNQQLNPNYYSATQQTVNYNIPQINNQDSQLHYNNVGSQNQQHSPNYHSAAQQTVNFNNPQTNNQNLQLHYNNVGGQNQQYAPNYYSATQISLNNHIPQTHYQDYNNVGSQNQQNALNHYSATQQTTKYNNQLSNQVNTQNIIGNNYDLGNSQQVVNTISTVDQVPAIKKHIYFHVPPPDLETQNNFVPVITSKKSYKIVFIKLPSQESKNSVYLQNQLNNLHSKVEEKTLIYVLVKKPEVQETVVQPKTISSNPEVFYVKYKQSPHESEDIAHDVNYELGDDSVTEEVQEVLQPGLINGQPH